MTPRRDSPKGRTPAAIASQARLRLAREVARRPNRRPNGKSGPAAGGAPCPVTPDRPLDLSGGAAAALEFDA